MATDPIDRELRKLERKLKSLYSEATNDLRWRVSDYLASFAARDAQMRDLVSSGEITKEYYQQWQRNQIGRGERWMALRDEMARRASECNQIAANYINDKTPTIRSMSANSVLEEARLAGYDMGGIIDEQAVRNLAMGRNQFEFQISDGVDDEGNPKYTYRRLRPNLTRDYAWNSDQIERQLTIGILSGDGIGKMTERFLSVMGSNRTAAIRNARTAVTSAQNAGSLETMSALSDMGIETQKEWRASMSASTPPRESHQQADGEIRNLDEPFSTGCMYPGDPAGEPAEVYNCRCVMKTVFPRRKRNEDQR